MELNKNRFREKEESESLLDSRTVFDELYYYCVCTYYIWGSNEKKWNARKKTCNNASTKVNTIGGLVFLFQLKTKKDTAWEYY